MDITRLQQFYHGFFIETPDGNNAFSFDVRQNKRIFVPPLIEGSVQDVGPGHEVVFSEVVDGIEVNAKGLRSFVYIARPGQDVFVFDNHNHAFGFWAEAFRQNVIPKGLPLVHVDQHKDTREPLKAWDGEDAFTYANKDLNVGNFIPPALKAGFFSEVIQVGSQSAFESRFPDRFVLDIDLDIFAPDMDLIPNQLKIKTIRRLLAKAPFVTIATSPFFIDPIRTLSCFQELMR